MDRLTVTSRWLVGAVGERSWTPYPDSPLFLSKGDAIIWIAHWMTFHPGKVPSGVRLVEKQVEISEVAQEY